MQFRSYLIAGLISTGLICLGTGCGGSGLRGSAIAPGHSIVLTWNASNSSGVLGYNIYSGSSAGGPYPTKTNVGNVTTYTMTNVPAGTYYLVATAYNATAESGYSNEAQASVTDSSLIVRAKIR